MTIKFGNFANFVVRDFVVIWEAPTVCKIVQGIGTQQMLSIFVSTSGLL